MVPRPRSSSAAWHFTTCIFHKGKADGKHSRVNGHKVGARRGAQHSVTKGPKGGGGQKRGKTKRGSGREAFLRRGTPLPFQTCLRPSHLLSLSRVRKQKVTLQRHFHYARHTAYRERCGDTEELDPHWLWRGIVMFACPCSIFGFLTKGTSFQDKREKRKMMMYSSEPQIYFIWTLRTDVLSVYSPRGFIY